MKIENEHSIELALEAKKASEEFHKSYPNSPFDKFYMGYVKGFQAAMTLLGVEIGSESDLIVSSEAMEKEQQDE